MGCGDPEQPEYPAEASAECLEFLQACLVYDTQSRPTVRQLLQLPFVAKSQLQASLVEPPEAEFESNPLEDKGLFGLASSLSQNLSRLKHLQPNRPAPESPADAPGAKALGWTKSTKEVKVAAPDKKKDPQPYQLASSVQTSDNLWLPEARADAKKSSRVAGDARELSSLEQVEGEKPRPKLGPHGPAPARAQPQAAPSKFVITALEPVGLVKNPSAWLPTRQLFVDSPELGPRTDSDSLRRIDLSHEAAERVSERPGERRTGLAPGPLPAQPPADAALRSKQLLAEVEAAQLRLLEELLQPEQAPAGPDLAAIELEQQRLLEDMLQAPPERLPTVVSLLDSPQPAAPADLGQIEALQQQLLAELVAGDAPGPTDAPGALPGASTPADSSLE